MEIIAMMCREPGCCVFGTANEMAQNSGYCSEHFKPSNSDRRKPHRIMTPEEYDSMAIHGWHEVCRNVDGHGAVGIRYLPQPEN